MIVREEIPLEDRWNVEAMYPSLEAWENSLAKVSREGLRPRWPEIASYKGRLNEGPQVLKTLCDLIYGLDRVLSTLYTYAHLRHDEDIANDSNKSAYSRIANIIHEFNREVSWFEPEFLSLSKEKIGEYIQSPELAEYRFYLEKIARMKEHTLSQESEGLLALGEQSLQTAHRAFSALSDADFSFGTIKDSEGKDHPLTHGQYSIYIRSHDRQLRENAFKKYHGKYLEFENTLCELLTGQANKALFHARARGYSSCVEAALYPHQIDPTVYHSLIQAVHSGLGSLHKYIQLRKKHQKLDKVHLYDLYVPLTENLEITMPYKEGENVVIESTAPLGTEYQNMLKKGLQEQRWVDRYENRNKRSGAYSSGCYESMPYILMNYKGMLRDVFTLAHEAGHSMHSLLSRKQQPYQYSQYPIFVAEVASTFNEELLLHYLSQNYTGKEEKIFLINQKIEDLRATLFRQTMFAEFELLIHQKVENHIPLTPSLLKSEYSKLNKKYFGDEIVIDTEAEIEWARIPHFYYNFYVYQYATGISAASALFEKVMNGGDQERNAYLTFLKSGGSGYPIDLLKTAGVDMRSNAPVTATIKKFDRLVDELDSLLSSKG